jgi:Ca2+-binding RTX toxin-like protein
MVVRTEDSKEAELGIELGELGTTVVAMLQIVPGRDVEAESMALAQLFGHHHAVSGDNRLATSDGGGFAPYASVVTDFANHLGQVRGNDLLAGGEGDDTLVGDDLTIVEHSFEFDAARMADAEALTRDLLDISDDFSDLIHEQYRLLSGLGSSDGQDTVLVDQVFEVGKDSLDGGEGNDVLIGDDSTLQAASFVVPVGLAFDFRLLIEGVSDAGDEIAHGVLDLIHLEHHLRDVTVLGLPDEQVERHIDHVLMGNDEILGGVGNDLIVGDALVTRSATVRLVAGGTAVQNGMQDAWHDDDWKDLGEEGELCQQFDFRHPENGVDPVRVGSDQIDGGLGNDLVFGDSLASITSTLQRASGILDADYDTARSDAWKALERLTMLTDTAADWLAFQDPGAGTAADAEFDDGDDLAGAEGDDILFGQDGEDIISGGDGDDWLIGGADKDVLDGGEGDDTLRSGEDSSSALREAVAARQVDWEGAFTSFGQSFSPFGVDATKLKSTGHLPGYLVLSEKNEETV